LKNNMKKSVLITGNAGLLGSRFADWILENYPEYEVVGIDNLFGGYIENVDDRVVFYKRELSLDSVKDIFDKHEFEYVFHFAAYAAEGLSPFMRKFNYSNNVLSTVNIINECISHKVKRLIYTSSMSVYGWGLEQGRVFDENDRPEPIDPYAISKYACEMDIKVAGEQHGLDWCIIRPHNVYGIKQNIWDKYRNVLGIWMYQILNDKPMLIYGDGEQTRAFSYIDDCLESFWNAAVLDDASKQIINVGGEVGISINEAAKTLCTITGYNNIEHKEARHEVKYAVPSPEKSKRILGYKQSTNLEKGLTEMWKWAQMQPNRKQYRWENYEITDGIYSYWK
jgi:UDP-glucose 4-epimerase